MKVRMARSKQSRLARLEAAVAKLARSPRFLPAQQADFFRYLCEEYADPAGLLPSARALRAALADCCAVFPEDGDADLAGPALAGQLPVLRQELLSFLETNLKREFYQWRYSMAWTDLGLAGFDVRVGARERGPTAQEWCAGLSDLEVVFEAVDCLVTAHSRVLDWLGCLDLLGSGCDMWKSVELPAEEEEVLLAQLDADTPEKRAALARAAHEERFPPGDPQMPTPTSAATRLLPRS